jgi:hypothetical protein
MGQTSSTRKNTQNRSGFDEEKNELNRQQLEDNSRARWEVGSKPLYRETTTGRTGRNPFNNTRRRFGATRRVQQPPLQQHVIGITRANINKIFDNLKTQLYIKNPRLLRKHLVTTFSVFKDVHTPVELFERINEIPALVRLLRWDPEISATLEEIKDINTNLDLTLLSPKERTVYRKRLREEIDKIITKPNDIYTNMGNVLKINKNVLKDTFGLIAAIKEGTFNNLPNRLTSIILNKYSDPINSLLLDAILSNVILLENVRKNDDTKETLRDILKKHERYPIIIKKINKILNEQGTRPQSSVSATSRGIPPPSVSATSLDVQPSVRSPIPSVGNTSPPSVIEISPVTPQSDSAPRPRSNSLQLVLPETAIVVPPPPPKKPWWQFFGGGTRRKRYKRKQKTMKQ